VTAKKIDSLTSGVSAKKVPHSRRVRAGGRGAGGAAVPGTGVATTSAVLPAPGLLLVDDLVAGQSGVARIGAAAARAARLLHDCLNFAGFSAGNRIISQRITSQVPRYYLLLIVFIRVLALLLFGQVAVTGGTAAGALGLLALLVLAASVLVRATRLRGVKILRACRGVASILAFALLPGISGLI